MVEQPFYTRRVMFKPSIFFKVLTEKGITREDALNDDNEEDEDDDDD